MYSHSVSQSLSVFCALVLMCPVMAGHADSMDVSQLKNPDDPWEGFNRKIYAFNDGLDRYFMLPVGSAYRFILPEPIDQGVTNFFTNLLMPLTIVNDCLQLKFKAAGMDVSRFFLNSTVGVFGVLDVASRVGLEEEPEDFGQTLGYWGVGSGPYLVLPFLGGRTVRDALGLIPDWAVSLQSNISNTAVRNSLLGFQLIDTRADLIPVEQLISGDRYIFLREAYLQQRRYRIADGDLADDFGEEDYDDFDDAAFGDELDSGPLPDFDQ